MTTRLLSLARRAGRRIRSDYVPASSRAGTDVRFRCNLCGVVNRAALSDLQREVPSCDGCRSTVRFRAIGELLAREVVGSDRPLCELRPARSIRGIGLTDSGTYASVVASRFDYTNTFYDAEPMLDITRVPDRLANRFDFVIASDVFEHVPPPVRLAFEGARTLLRDNGVLILTVPHSLEDDTTEHFPDLFDYRIEGRGGDAVLHNVTRDGSAQRFDRLVFHGGIGATLEMRRFSRAGLERELRLAGFTRVVFAGEPCERFGIHWHDPMGIPVVARV